MVVSTTPLERSTCVIEEGGRVPGTTRVFWININRPTSNPERQSVLSHTKRFTPRGIMDVDLGDPSNIFTSKDPGWKLDILVLET